MKTEMFACSAPQKFDAEKYARDFPALAQDVHGSRLVFLDNGASSQKPRQVLEAMTRFYEHDYANVHRGVHTLSHRATDKFEHARETVRRFIHARKTSEIVFCRGGTEAINLVAQSWGRANLKTGDEILVSELEHHSNFVPWQMAAQAAGAFVKPIAITENGDITLENVAKAITPKTRLIAITHISNVLGSIVPVQEIVALAHSKNIVVLVDGCQAVPHMPVDVQALACDFYVFSAHKMFGPSGIGVLYGREDLLNAMPPYQTGGGMIEIVSFEKTTFKPAPERFEAGTPAIAEAVGLSAAIDYITTIGLDRIACYEHELLAYALDKLAHVNSLRVLGKGENRAAVLSFVMEGVHPHDVGSILDRYGVAVRTGHHCAQPLMEKLGVPATTRASFAFYNTKADVDALVSGLEKVREIFA